MTHEFGKVISQLRKDKGLTQKELADKVGVSDKAVSRWETGKNYPDIETLQRLAEVLDVSVNDLLSGDVQLVDKKKANRSRWMAVVLVLIVVVGGFALTRYVCDHIQHEVTGSEHLGPLTYEMPGDGYTHAKADIISQETGVEEEIVIIGKIYHKDKDVEITVSENPEQWHEFDPLIEYEKSTNYDYKDYYKNENPFPDLIEKITVFHGDGDDAGNYDVYYKAYITVFMGNGLRQYIITVRGNSFEEVRKEGETFLNSMNYDNSLEAEFIKQIED